MKRLMLMLMLTTAALTATAQPGRDFSPGGGRRGEPPPNGHPEGGPASPLRQWMRELRQQDPEEFARLQELRRENPAAFREQAGAALEQRLLRRLQTVRPGVHDALAAMKPEDRQWLLQQWAAPLSGSPDEPPPPPAQFEPARKLIADYRQATTPEDKAALREQLSAELARQYDERLNRRREQLADAEAKLESLRRALAEGEAERDRFIQDRLNRWLKP